MVSTGREYDIRDHSLIERLVKKTRPEIVVNFAALTTVKETFDDPLKTYDIGFFGTLNLLNSLKKLILVARI